MYYLAMENIDAKLNTVPFDPGLGQFVLTFSTTYFYLDAQVRKFKNINQRKMKYKAYEPSLFKLCDNLISFYFCGMLYGAYLKNKYKNNPAQIEGNAFLGLSVEDCIQGDVTIEVQTLEKFIKNNDRNPFATKQINPKYIAIIDSYIEFLEVNNYFTSVKTTADLKIPQKLSYIDEFSDAKLDEIYDVLNDCIDAKKVEKIINSVYFNEL